MKFSLLMLGLISFFGLIGAGFAPAEAPIQTGGIKRALVTLDSDVSTPHNTNVVASWGVVQYDTASFFNPSNPTKLIVPSGVNFVVIGCSVVWQQNIIGNRQAVILKNGSFFNGGYVETQPANNRTTADFSGWTAPIPVQEGDEFEVYVMQTSGGNLNLYKSTGTWFSIVATE